MIIKNIKQVSSYLKNNNLYTSKEIYLTSGGFDPLHVGHLRCIQETVNLSESNSGIVVIIVNDDGFLLRKKGYAFMPIDERMEIINGIAGVDIVTTWDDGSQTVVGAINLLRPNFFTKGGDRTDFTNVPEHPACLNIGCEIIFGVGGGKIQSSSDLVANMSMSK
jgi:D-beta-D-heptose 7-phosphate kinase/D-beta-D-heptose 1-phosphate adenosyltransferase